MPFYRIQKHFIKIHNYKSLIVRIRDSLASIDKAKRLLGYIPAFDVHEGLKLAVKWYFDSLK
jgi:UDP-N-acetylglucosamine 4-epimerase